MKRWNLLGLVLVAAAVWQLPTPAGAADFHLTSGERQAVLLELFTSEGCSSCPPAEAWLGKLESHPDLWRNFVPVAFHVDYWDRLGWPDKLASKEFTARQHRYATAWGSRSVYTPGFVSNGLEWRGWYQGGRLPEPTGPAVGVLAAHSTNGMAWTVTFQPASSSVRAGEAHIALLGFDVSSAVRAGENRGRTLQHSFAALALVSAPLRAQDGRLTAHLTLPAATPVTAPRRALAVWVTEADGRTVRQATGGWLTRDKEAAKETGRRP